jgi:hypothetical protein
LRLNAISEFRGQTELPLSLELCGRFLKVPAPSGLTTKL